MKTFTLTIDGRQFTVEGDGKNLLHVCLSLGFNLPYFCWHPALHSVGACRQCAVKLYKDEADTRGRIVMSCMTPVVDRMRVSVEDQEAQDFRKGITELLMVNHPHDCPICDEGGECHLQDMVVMTGHTYRRYRFTKRTHRNQDLGPFLNHEMNRCIQCYRCIRFYRDYAGGRDLEALGAHDNVYFGRHADGTLENEFSGNLVEVCPTGVFTDKTLKRHYTRKWDLQTAPSVCVHCAVGCNTIPGERYGTIRRVRTRYNGEVNGYFLCDRGRYGYEFVNGPDRITHAFHGSEQVTPETAMKLAAGWVGAAPRLVGIGSPRASLEANYALRDLVGAENFFSGVPDARLEREKLMLQVLRDGPAGSASVKEASQADAVLVLGEDAWNTAPILALNLRPAASNAPAAAAIRQKKLNRWDDAALRESIRDERGPFFVASVEATELDTVARECFRGAPADIARLGFAVAHELDPAAPAVEGLTAAGAATVKRVAAALKTAERPLIVSGGGLGSTEVIQAAANVSRALCAAGREAKISLVFSEANSFAQAILARGGLESSARAVGSDTVLVVLENDVSRALGREAARALLGAAAHVISLDHTANATTKAAELVLPATSYAETTGTLVSSEGRAQRYFGVTEQRDEALESWRWISRLAAGSGRRARGWLNIDAVLDSIAAELPELAGAKNAAPGADFRRGGQRVPRKALRESGRTAVTANVDIHEPMPDIDPDSPLSHTMEGFPLGAPSSLNARFWYPGWNSDQALNKFQAEVGGPLKGGDPGVRLVEPPSAPAGRYFGAPLPEARRDGLVQLVARHHVFGSDELSALAPGVAERSAKPCVALSAAEAGRLGLVEGQAVTVSPDGGEAVELPLVIRELPAGVAAVPFGLAGAPHLDLPAWARITGGRR
jgi:NADH-quinone oxidoreductase subunit G